MPKLIMLRGNSGSGKTSVAKELQQKFGKDTMLISQDMVRREILNTTDGVDTKALPLLIELLKYGRRNSAVTILEGILYTGCYMQLFETAVSEFGEEIFAYYYDIPFEETLARHQTRDKRDVFGEEHMKRWWNEKDYMKLIPETAISKDMGLEETVEMIYGTVCVG